MTISCGTQILRGNAGGGGAADPPVSYGSSGLRPTASTDALGTIYVSTDSDPPFESVCVDLGDGPVWVDKPARTPAPPASLLVATPNTWTRFDTNGEPVQLSDDGVRSALGVGGVSLPTSLADAVAWLDPETLPAFSSGDPVRTWRGLNGELARMAFGTAPTLNATAPASLDYSAAAACQRIEGLSIAGAAPRTLAVWITKGGTYGKKWLAVWGYLYGIYLYGDTPQVEHGTGAVLDAGATIDGSRHLIVSTYNGSVGKLYVDGVLVDTRTYGGLPTTAQPWAIAARGDVLYEPFNGRIHAAGAWDRALSADEVTALNTWITGR